MLKQRILRVIMGVVVMVAVTGTSGIVADALGLFVTPQAQACDSSSSAGGGC